MEEKSTPQVSHSTGTPPLTGQPGIHGAIPVQGGASDGGAQIQNGQSPLNQPLTTPSPTPSVNSQAAAVAQGGGPQRSDCAPVGAGAVGEAPSTSSREVSGAAQQIASDPCASHATAPSHAYRQAQQPVGARQQSAPFSSVHSHMVQSVTTSAAAQQPIVLQLPAQKVSKAPWVLLGIALIIILLMVGSCAAIPFSLIHSLSSIDEHTLDSFSSEYPTATHEHSVAVIHWDDQISARGAINPEQVRNQLISAAQDDKIDAILIRCNCPGGTVAASEEIAVYISQCPKPVVFSVSDLCASGAYMGASQADAIVAMPTSEVGSIGVIMSHTDLTGLMDKLGIKIDPIKSDNAKDAGAYYREMTDEERAKFEQEVKEYHNKFIHIVAQGRNLSEDEVRQIATGEVFAGDKALDLGLIDRLGTLDDALDVVAELTGVPYADLSLLNYDQKPSFGSLLGLPYTRYPNAVLEELLGGKSHNLYEDSQKKAELTR